MTKSKISKKTQKAAEKWLRKLHPKTKLVMFLFLVIGIIAAFLAGNNIQRNDQFSLNGEAVIHINVGGEYVEPVDAVTCISFGRDVTSKVVVNELETTYDPLTSPQTPGTYYIVYETTDFKYSKIKRIRKIVVNEILENEDGIGE